MSVDLRQGDCLDVLASLADGSVDAVVTDPPYGTTQASWDTPVDWRTFWRQVNRVCRADGAVVMTAAGRFVFDLQATNPGQYRYKWSWDRVGKATGHLDANRRPLRRHEDVLVFGQRQPRYFPVMTPGPRRKATQSADCPPSSLYGSAPKKLPYCSDVRHPVDVLAYKPVDSRLRDHPTQKPVEMLAFLIECYSLPGEVILDPFLGSGSTGVACAMTGRNVIGIERDPGYLATARRRIDAARAAQGVPA